MSKKSNNQKKMKKNFEGDTSLLKKKLNISCNNEELLHRSLIHRSYINESESESIDNERLEYLGDSVLALVVNEYLYQNYPDYKEGSLAKIKSVAVSEITLAKIARKIKLGDFLYLGKGEEVSGGRERSSILADTFEAVIGAIYLDSGLKNCRDFILYYLKPYIEKIDQQTYFRDPKTTIQEYVQKQFKKHPEYVIISEIGPDHQKEFVVQLNIVNRKFSVGKGSSKRKAEMDAAISALKKIQSRKKK